MLKALQKRDARVRILLGFVVVLVGGAMVITLVPGTVSNIGTAPNVLVTVDGEPITIDAVERDLRQLDQQGTLTGPLRAFYAQQVIDRKIFERLLAAEARRLGIRVTDAERTERIKQLLPMVFAGDTFSTDRYAVEVRDRFSLTVPEFEALIEQAMIEDKIYRLVTDGITVAPEEIESEYRRRNERVRLEYVRIEPAVLEARVPVPEDELAAYFQANQSRYQVPERRAIRYILADREEMKRQVSVSDEELRAYYETQIERFRIQNRARVRHILFHTRGKTDAEIAEIRARAEDVLRRARRGTRFEDLARQFSEDAATKENGGDLGWIGQGQTVPEFEQAAFGLPKGSISDLIVAPYGIHIVQVVDREQARTRTFEEVRETLRPELAGQKLERAVAQMGDRLAAEVRQSSRRPIQELAAAVGLPVRTTDFFALGEPMNSLGSAEQLQQAVFRLRPDELSAPVLTERGYAVFAVREIQPARQGTLNDTEIRRRVTEDFRRERAIQLARTRAEELARRAQGGEPFAAAARALGFTPQTSEPITRSESIPGLGSGRELAAAFSLEPGRTGSPVQVGADWAVFRVVERTGADPAAFATHAEELRRQLLQNRRETAYEAFRRSLRERMTLEGKVEFNDENMRRMTQVG